MYAAFSGASISILVTALIWRHILYPLFLSPFASVPVAHPLARFTSLWIEWQRLRGTDFQSISSAFATKGPYVRLAPRELAINDIEGVNCVWGVGAADFDKHPSYEYWATQGTLNTFTTVDGSEHRRRHKRIRGVHNNSFISSSPHIREIMRYLMIDRLSPFLTQISASSAGITDVMPMALSIILGCTSAFAFGIPLSLDFLFNPKAGQEWFDLFAIAFPTDQATFWLREHPQLTKVLCFLGIPVVSRETAKARSEFEAWPLPMVDAAEELLQKRDKGEPIANGQFPVLYDAVRTDLAKSHTGTEKPNFTMTAAQRRELGSECFDHIAFTAEAFGTVFTYMLYELSRNQDAQSELIAELHSFDNPLRNTNDQTNVPDSETLQHLPFLSAVIKECLRLRNTSPNADPRVTPMHGPSRIGKLPSVPPGTRVCCYGWCLHRNPDVYADPLIWDPRRWLEGGCDDPTAAKRWAFPFGAGSRNCIGQYIAMELFRMSLATVYTNYTTHVVDETVYPGRNQPMSSTLTEKLVIRFEKQPPS